MMFLYFSRERRPSFFLDSFAPLFWSKHKGGKNKKTNELKLESPSRHVQPSSRNITTTLRHINMTLRD